MHFFDKYSGLLKTSTTGVWRDRLVGRYEAIIERNRACFDGARVLDIASHDGRWSLAALDAGAQHVTGIEIRESLVAKSHENMEAEGVAVNDLYTFALERLDKIQKPKNVHFTADGSRQLGEREREHRRR